MKRRINTRATGVALAPQAESSCRSIQPIATGTDAMTATSFGNRNLAPRIGIVICLCLASGCNVFDLTKKFDLSRRIPWIDPDAEEPHPVRVTALWSHTVLNQQGQRGVRGFGGRLMFHGKESERPARVDGSLTVYAFDETNRTSSIPERKFVFTAEQFEKHYSKSKLGHSYSIWLPWDEVGGPPRRISLVARFEPTEGGMITSETSLQTLPGISPEPEYDAGDEPKHLETSSGIQQAGYQETSTKVTRQKPNWEEQSAADTINLPANFGRRFNSPNAQVPSQQTKTTATTIGEPTKLAAIQLGNDARDQVETAESNDSPDTSTRKSNHSATPMQSLNERKKELSNHFEWRKSRVQRASPAQSRLAPPPSRQSLPDAQSDQPQSSSREEKDPFDSDLLPDSAGSR